MAGGGRVSGPDTKRGASLPACVRPRAAVAKRQDPAAYPGRGRRSQTGWGGRAVPPRAAKRAGVFSVFIDKPEWKEAWWAV